MRKLIALILTILTVFLRPASASVPVRIDDNTTSHCIDATREHVSIDLRRIWMMKKNGFFTEDKRAGVLVRSSLAGQGDKGVSVEVPSVNLVTISDEPRGRVSVPVEYSLASNLALNKNDILTTGIELSIYLAKTQGRNTFGELLDTASGALKKLPIPPNPYSQIGDALLQYANDTINKATKDENSDKFADIDLKFSDRSETVAECRRDGMERTGAFAVLQPTGEPNTDLIPMENIDQLYCFKYSSRSTYELLAAKTVNGECPPDSHAYTGVHNNYVLFLISAHPVKMSGMVAGPDSDIDKLQEESRSRCSRYHLPATNCGF